jgi:hypothetical protein
MPNKNAKPKGAHIREDLWYDDRILCGAEIWGIEWGGKQWKWCRGGLYEKINKNP